MTGPRTSPFSIENTIGSHSAWMLPRWNQPSSPPDALVPSSSDIAAATSANVLAALDPRDRLGRLLLGLGELLLGRVLRAA